MEIKRSKKISKFLKKLQPKTAKRTSDAIDKLPSGDIETITGRIDEYRLRVGDFRILFIINDDLINVTNILSRGQAYKKGTKNERTNN